MLQMSTGRKTYGMGGTRWQCWHFHRALRNCRTAVMAAGVNWWCLPPSHPQQNPCPRNRWGVWLGKLSWCLVKARRGARDAPKCCEQQCVGKKPTRAWGQLRVWGGCRGECEPSPGFPFTVPATPRQRSIVLQRSSLLPGSRPASPGRLLPECPQNGKGFGSRTGFFKCYLSLCTEKDLFMSFSVATEEAAWVPKVCVLNYSCLCRYPRPHVPSRNTQQCEIGPLLS